jgi:hypothetical protein
MFLFPEIRIIRKNQIPRDMDVRSENESAHRMSLTRFRILDFGTRENDIIEASKVFEHSRTTSKVSGSYFRRRGAEPDMYLHRLLLKIVFRTKGKPTF